MNDAGSEKGIYTMNPGFKDMTNFIIKAGAADIPHSEKTYLAHTIGVYKDLKAWDCDEELCRTGMFHSIYGTEGFQDFTLPLERRSELSALIGERAERIAYWNCAMDRPSFDANLAQVEGPCRIVDRLTQQEVELSREDFDDLCRVHLCDFLELVARSEGWNYRRAAYRKMAERLGGVALEAYDRVFAQAPAG